MYRSKKDVDRLVRDTFSKFKSDNERKLRGYTIARAYYNVGEYDTGRHHLNEFLCVRPKSFDGHKLLGQIHEASGNKDKAVLAYVAAYKLTDSPKDLVIKICELYTTVSCEVSKRVFWAEEGQRLYPHHEAVTSLRTSIIARSTDNKSREELQQLYTEEIKVQPTSAQLQSNLVQLYVDWSKDDSSKLNVGYAYVKEVEARRPFTESLLWYSTVLALLGAYEAAGFSCGIDHQILYITCLERQVHLTLQMAASSTDKSNNLLNNVGTPLLHRFDSRLEEVLSQAKDYELKATMTSQLFYHLAHFLMISAKPSTSSSNQIHCCLLLHSCRGPLPSNSHYRNIKAHTTSHAAHILYSVAADTNTSVASLAPRYQQQCSNEAVKREVYRSAFGAHANMDKSYLLHYSEFETVDLLIPDDEILKECDSIVARKLCAEVGEISWLYLQDSLLQIASSTPFSQTILPVALDTSVSNNSASVNHSLKNVVNKILGSNHPYFPHTIFKNLQFSCQHMNSAVPDSLCHLDLVIFLCGSLYCSLDDAAGNIYSLATRSSVCGRKQLATEMQENWWKASHTLYSNSSVADKKKVVLSAGIAGLRQTVQRGLESIRLLPSSGISLRLALHLARCVKFWAAGNGTEHLGISELNALEARAEHCWKQVLAMCGKSYHMSSSQKKGLFHTIRENLSATELEAAEEEGKLYLALHLVKHGKRHEALQALGQLRAPEASFERANVYKEQALEMISAVGGDASQLTPEQKGQHLLLLTQCRDTLYLTLDRLRMPGVDRKHHLNEPLSKQLDIVERAIASLSIEESSRVLLNSSAMLFSAHEEDNYGGDDSSIYASPLSPIQRRLNMTNGDCNLLATPRQSTSQKPPFQRRMEARPSPERLDAQVRHLTNVQEQTLANLGEQNAALRSHNSALKDTVATITKQVEENTQLFKSILEQNKSTAMDCYQNILMEIKPLYPAIKELQTDLLKLKAELLDLKNSKLLSAAEGANNPVNNLPSNPGMFPGGFPLLGYYGAMGTAPHLATPNSMFPSPYTPPISLQDPAFMSTMQLHQRALQHQLQIQQHDMANFTAASVSSPRTPTPAPPPTPIAQPPPPSHNYHISVPAATPVTPRQIEPSMPALSGLLASVPAPQYSAVNPNKTIATSASIFSPASMVKSNEGKVFTTTPKDSSFLSSAIGPQVVATTPKQPTPKPHDSNEYYQDDGHDPCPDYQPVVPLPDKVDIMTGEESELTLFEERAKLHRMVDKEWKERGTGVLKILHHKDKYTNRIIMRRDQTLKICANHLIYQHMKLLKMPKTDCVFIWGAQDFSGDQTHLETFCVRFKTPEIASKFNQIFMNAVANDPELTRDDDVFPATNSSTRTSKSPSPSVRAPLAKDRTTSLPPISEMFKKQAGSWNCQTCLVNNQPQHTACLSCQTPNPSAPPSADVPPPSFSFGKIEAPVKASGSITFGVSGKAMSVSTPTFTPVLTAPSTTLNTPKTAAFQQSVFGTPQNIASGTPCNTPTGVMFGQVSKVTTTTPSKPSFGGFTFSSTPNITSAKDEKKDNGEINLDGVKKESIFSSLSFGSGKEASNGSGSFSFGKVKEEAPKVMSFVTPAVSSSTSGFGFGTVKTEETKLTAAYVSSTEGGLFSGPKKDGSELTFGALATVSNKTKSEMDENSMFKTKDLKAFTPAPPFGVGNSSMNKSDAAEEYEPEVHFEPVIPLPELITVTTGEEDENTMFCERAKLFRYVKLTSEWKERGLGEVKVLKNNTSGKFRILMRREKTLKICANHYITESLEMKYRSDSQKALNWVANDFSEGVVVTEQFAIRFKSEELTANFKRAVEDAKTLLNKEDPLNLSKPSEPEGPKSKTSFADKFKPSAGSWECDKCLVRNGPSNTNCLACMANKPGISFNEKASTSSAQPALASLFKVEVGSWTCDTCMLTNIPGSVACAACQTQKPGCTVVASISEAPKTLFGFGIPAPTDRTPKPSFSFGLPSSSEVSKTPKSSIFGTDVAVTPKPSIFGTDVSLAPKQSIFGTDVTVTPKKSIFGAGDLTVTPKQSIFGTSLVSTPKQTGDVQKSPSSLKFGSPHEFSFTPRSRDVSKCESEDGGYAQEDDGDHLYFEPVVPLPDKVEVFTGEENDVVLYSHRAKLLRMVNKEWKERGLGDVKILLNKITHKPRLLMRREKVHKICLNHYLGPTIEFRVKDEKTYYWVAQDFSEGESTTETFAIRFKTAEIATEFKNAVENAIAGDFTVDETADANAVDGEAELIKRLMLPADFFSYKNKTTACPAGCYGCRQDTIPALLIKEDAFAVLLDYNNEIYDVDNLKMCAPNTISTSTVSSSFCNSVLNQVGKGGSIFGKVIPKSSSSIFGSSTAIGPSIFGAKSTFGDVNKPVNSMFDVNTPVKSVLNSSELIPASSNSFFGSSTTTTCSGAIFGCSKTTMSSSIFGGNTAASSSASVFGNSGAAPGSIFGGNTQPSGSIFGGQSSISSPSIFGGSVSSKPSLFGGSISNSSNTGKSIFGGAVTPNTSKSLFGGATGNSPLSERNNENIENTDTENTEAAQVVVGSLFGGELSNKNLTGFGDILNTNKEATTGFLSKSKTETNSAWKTQKPFASLNSSVNNNSANKEESNAEEDDNYDPHYEPVIPLPDIVDVKTGEEDLEVIYSHRCKTFRYEAKTKEWKERGLGDIKILFDPVSEKYRLLQRRDQIHKLAVLHYILPDLKLTPMAASETAWCWFAHDFSEAPQGTLEQIAARFKNAEVAQEFRSKIEECITKATSTSIVLHSTANDSTLNEADSTGGYTEQHYYDEEGDEDGDYEDYINSDILFDYECNLEKQMGEAWTNVGTVFLRLVQESDSEGLRLMATDHEEALVLDQMLSGEQDIAMCSSRQGAVVWKALDLSSQPAENIRLRATFGDATQAEEFFSYMQMEDPNDYEDEDAVVGAY